ncbi:MAG: TIGR03905 family TSCPD domain-containing protein [Bacteroidaceae bacterium]|nr:TIGR03905 family TSCPD domain-containing protein [Bacteroidaceae bacterium]
MKGIYTTRGTCSQQIEIEVDDQTHVIHSVAFIGGCHGNTQGISELVKGQKAEDIISKLQGIRCGMKTTSCPDQLAQALKACLKRIEEKA